MEETTADLDQVLKAYGMAMAVAQVLEVALHTSVVRLGLYSQPGEEGDLLQLITEESRSTMGQLIGRLHAYEAISDEVRAALRTVARRRNELAHSFFRANLHLLGSQEGCARLVDELIKLIATFTSVQEVITRATLAAMAGAGDTPDLSPAGRKEFGIALERDTKLQEAFKSLGFTQGSLLDLASLAKSSGI